MANNASTKTTSKPVPRTTTSDVTHSTQAMQPMPDLIDYVREYARQKPEVAAMWCFGIGFVVGWKLKPW